MTKDRKKEEEEEEERTAQDEETRGPDLPPDVLEFFVLMLSLVFSSRIRRQRIGECLRMILVVEGELVPHVWRRIELLRPGRKKHELDDDDK